LLTPAQREDLRLWNGRIDLLDRVKFARRYALLTVVATGLGLTGFVAGLIEMPPFILAPIVPAYFSVKLWRRSRSLRDSGLKLRRVYVMLRARWALPMPLPMPSDKQLLKLASRELLESHHGGVIRRAMEDRLAISAVLASMSKADRALLPDVEPTAKALVERVAELAQNLHQLERDIDPRMRHELDRHVPERVIEGASPEGQRRLVLITRQRATFDELVERHAVLKGQRESALLALGNLRLDLIKFRSCGLQSALSDVSTATQEARALTRDIVAALEAAAEVRSL
jgi:hypothetical protein